MRLQRIVNQEKTDVPNSLHWRVVPNIQYFDQLQDITYFEAKTEVNFDLNDFEGWNDMYTK